MAPALWHMARVLLGLKVKDMRPCRNATHEACTRPDTRAALASALDICNGLTWKVRESQAQTDGVDNDPAVRHALDKLQAARRTPLHRASSPQ